MDSCRVGYLSELAAQRRVAELGIDILLPTGPNTAFDFVAHLGGRFSRIQVKTARMDYNVVVFNTATGSYNNRRGLTPEDTDMIMAITPTGECHVVRPNGKNGRRLTGEELKETLLKDASQIFVVDGMAPTRKVRGVNWHPRTNTWVVAISVGGKRRSVGYFKNHEDAVLAAEKARTELSGVSTPDVQQPERDAGPHEYPTKRPTPAFVKNRWIRVG